MNVLNDVDATCRQLSIAKSTLYLHVQQGLICPVKRGKRTFFHRDEIERYASTLPLAVARTGTKRSNAELATN